MTAQHPVWWVNCNHPSLYSPRHTAGHHTMHLCRSEQKSRLSRKPAKQAFAKSLAHFTACAHRTVNAQIVTDWNCGEQAEGEVALVKEPHQQTCDALQRGPQSIPGSTLESCPPRKASYPPALGQLGSLDFSCSCSWFSAIPESSPPALILDSQKLEKHLACHRKSVGSEARHPAFKSQVHHLFFA